MLREPLYVVAVLCATVALSEWLVHRTWLRHLGAALLVIVITAVVANLGLIPTWSEDQPIYAGVFAHVARIGIFCLLLQVRLAGLVAVGPPLFALFLVGALGTIAGVLCGIAVVGTEAFGERGFALAGMFAGTYIGGSANFNAVALEYDVVADGLLYAGATVVDAGLTTVWMIVNVAVPRVFAGRRAKRGIPSTAGARPRGQESAADARSRGLESTSGAAADSASEPHAALSGPDADRERVNPLELALVIGLAAFAVQASEHASAALERALGLGVPSMLVLTTVALLLAQVPAVARLSGTRLVGMLAVMLFLAVIGALCDVRALANIGPLGLRLLAFAGVLLAVHGAVVYGVAALFRVDFALASVASQANVGGGTSALALARSLGRGDLVLPSILVGALGTALGSYAGFAVAAWLR